MWGSVFHLHAFKGREESLDDLEGGVSGEFSGWFIVNE
jgi:hypothetical protein